MRLPLRTLGLLLLLLQASHSSAGEKKNKPELIASGTLILEKSDLITKAKGIRTLFLIVSDPKSPRPMPYGAKKIELEKDASGKFYKFEITTANLMTMGQHAAVPKQIRLKARLDKDGSAGMDQPGDIVGISSSLELGSSDINIVLDQAK